MRGRKRRKGEGKGKAQAGQVEHSFGSRSRTVVNCKVHANSNNLYGKLHAVYRPLSPVVILSPCQNKKMMFWGKWAVPSRNSPRMGQTQLMWIVILFLLRIPTQIPLAVKSSRRGCSIKGHMGVAAIACG